MDSPRSCKSYSISRKQLYEVIKVHRKWNLKYDEAFSHVSQAMDLEEKSGEVRAQVKKDVVREVSKFKSRLGSVKRGEEKFLAKYNDWLNKTITFSIEETEDETGTSVGRPSKAFDDSSDRSKRRKTQTLREEYTTPELTLATKMKLRSSGKVAEANLIEEALSTPSRAKKITSAWKLARLRPPVTPLTPEEGLALMIDANLSRSAYEKVRQIAKSKNADIYPSSKRVRAAKEKCYPPTITVTETLAKVELQPLLDHTVRRICEYIKEVLDSVPDSARQNLVLIWKWGCDGSSNQSAYKQGSEAVDLRDSSLFMTCLVPLQLHAFQETEGETKTLIVWQNPRTSSTRFCRPVKLEFAKETDQLVLKEKQEMQDQIDKLVATECTGDGYDVTIKHQLCLTMIDGKVCQVLTETPSSATCTLCGATPVQMNKIDKVLERPIREEAVEFGLSTLHAWIRFLEWLLNVSYRLGVKKWQVRADFKKEVEDRKRAIQEQFRSETGLLLDIVKQGSGTTNDGNTARRFFRDTEVSARITGLNKDLLHRCSVILRTLSSGYEINVSAFQDYSLATAKLYLALYPCYYMPASVHKVLIHGAQIVKACPLPIGMLSEEAQEARNKDFRHYRRDRSRKTSREATNTDVFHLMLASSDPIISSLRETPKRFTGSLSEDVVSLLKEPSSGKSNCESESDDDCE